MQLVVAKVIFRIVKDLSRILSTCKGRVQVSGNDWCIVNQVDKSTRMLGQNGLLFSTLDGCCEVLVVRLLEFLASLHYVSTFTSTASIFGTYDIRQLCLSNQALGFGANKLLFKLDNLGALRLLVLQLGNLVRDLG